MDKATPTTPPAPASYDSVMALYKEVMEALLFDSDSVADAETEFLAEVASLAAQAAPSEQADLRQLMGMNEAEIDTELIAAGISPDDAVKRADRAIKEALATIRAERRASSGATTAQAVYVPRLLTALEICRQYPDFDADTAIGTMLDAAIKGEPNEMLDLVSPHTGAAQAVRMLTREELNDVALSDQVGWEPGEYIEAVQRKFCAVNAGRAIPPDGKIGGV